MFGNLIESGSHTQDLKRKGSFFLGAFVFYAALLMAAGVGSIYAYNARLEEDSLELVEMLRFPPMPQPKIETERRSEPRPAAGSSNRKDD